MQTDPKEPQQSPDFPNAFYRITVKGLFVRDGKVLFTHDFTNPRREHTGGELELPGGGLDFGEDFHTALRREVKEEMGLTVSTISPQPIYVWTAKHGPGRGMDWFYVMVVVFRVEIDNIESLTPTDECREIMFLSKEEMRARSTEFANQIQPLIEIFDPKDFKGA